MAPTRYPRKSANASTTCWTKPLMIDFWLAAGLLLLVALSFLLIPVLRGRRAQREEDRTALNVALYQERVAELQTQQAEGVLDAAQLDTGRAEAARELLADTEGVEAPRESRLGKPLPLLAAFLVPVLGLGLYLHFGASDKVELTREFAQPPVSLQDMTQRLERAAAAQPDSAEGLYFLGRAYMAQDRSADAAKVFERAVALAGRQPELLGQWAQAQYFADNKQWSPKVQALTDEALKLDPKEVTSLGLLGIAAFEGQRYQEAIDYWSRLLAQLPPEDNSRAALQGGIDRAAQKLKESGGTVAQAKQAATLKVRVAVSAEVKAKALPGDSVFIFARAVSGPPAPLAAKRVTVAELPITVELGDADAMMPQLKLSNFPEVQLVARISRAGQPTAGEWIGRSQPLASSTTALQQLTIDSPDKSFEETP
jgi:cytochrome c-type biogenesis protein CcmH